MRLIHVRSLFLIGLALAVAHAGRTPARAQGPGLFPRLVTDGAGRRVTVLARPATIALVGDAPELRAIVEPRALRQVDPLDDPAAFDWSGVGLLVLSDLHAAINPAWAEVAAAHAVPVFQVSAITGLDQWRAAVRALGEATGRDEQSAAALRRLEVRLTRLATSLAAQPQRRALVLSPEGYTFGQGTLITDLFNAIGARNVAAEAGFDDYRQLDDAMIARLAPDVILLSPAWNAGQIEALRANPAIRRAQVFRLPFSPTLPDDPAAAALVLALALYPTALLH